MFARLKVIIDVPAQADRDLNHPFWDEAEEALQKAARVAQDSLRSSGYKEARVEPEDEL